VAEPLATGLGGLVFDHFTDGPLKIRGGYVELTSRSKSCLKRYQVLNAHFTLWQGADG